ncbi:putative beta-tubulin polyglutamylase [Diplonema papillatum]|nr:putative beta-tubulin polyglutamylase [Diplonema papillatum]
MAAVMTMGQCQHVESRGPGGCRICRSPPAGGLESGGALAADASGVPLAPSRRPSPAGTAGSGKQFVPGPSGHPPLGEKKAAPRLSTAVSPSLQTGLSRDSLSSTMRTTSGASMVSTCGFTGGSSPTSDLKPPVEQPAPNHAFSFARSEPAVCRDTAQLSVVERLPSPPAAERSADQAAPGGAAAAPGPPLAQPSRLAPALSGSAAGPLVGAEQARGDRTGAAAAPATAFGSPPAQPALSGSAAGPVERSHADGRGAAPTSVAGGSGAAAPAAALGSPPPPAQPRRLPAALGGGVAERLVEHPRDQTGPAGGGSTANSGEAAAAAAAAASAAALSSSPPPAPSRFPAALGDSAIVEHPRDAALDQTGDGGSTANSGEAAAAAGSSPPPAPSRFPAALDPRDAGVAQTGLADGCEPAAAAAASGKTALAGPVPGLRPQAPAKKARGAAAAAPKSTSGGGARPKAAACASRRKPAAAAGGRSESAGLGGTLPAVKAARVHLVSRPGTPPPAPAAALGSPCSPCSPCSPGPKPAAKQPAAPAPAFKKRRSLVSRHPRGAGRAGACATLVHLSPLYFRPFFTYGIELLSKAPGHVVSQYTVSTTKMTPDFLAAQQVAGAAPAVVYFLAQPVYPAFFERLPAVPAVQIVSHFPRTELVCDKVSLAVLLEALRQRQSREWSFTPTSCTSSEAYLEEVERNPKGAWIVKEDRGAGGQGIRIMCQATPEVFAESKCVVQRYIEPPLLIEGKRFDIRVYVLVTSFAPLRVFMGTEGVVHLCSENYSGFSTDADVGPLYRHVTNHAINSKAPGYHTGNKSGTAGNNRGYAALEKAFPGDVAGLWRQIRKTILKALAAAKPFVDAAQAAPGAPPGARCYELFGYDLIVSAAPELRPYLLEVNQFPSWVVAGSWFMHIKTRMLRSLTAFWEALGRYPEPGRCDLHDLEAMTGAEDAALRKADPPFFERIWPCLPGDKAWASLDDAREVQDAISLARSVFGEYAAALDPQTIASLPTDQPLFPPQKAAKSDGPVPAKDACLSPPAAPQSAVPAANPTAAEKNEDGETDVL